MRQIFMNCYVLNLLSTFIVYKCLYICLVYSLSPYSVLDSNSHSYKTGLKYQENVFLVCKHFKKRNILNKKWYENY